MKQQAVEELLWWVEELEQAEASLLGEKEAMEASLLGEKEAAENASWVSARGGRGVGGLLQELPIMWGIDLFRATSFMG
jgi:hypothetical protein